MNKSPKSNIDEKRIVAHRTEGKNAGAAVLDIGSGNSGTLSLRVEFLSDYIVRIRANTTGKFGKTLQERDGFIKSDWKKTDIKMIETGDGLKIAGKKVAVQFNRNPFAFSFFLGEKLLTGSSRKNGIRIEDGRFILTMDAPVDEKFLGLGYQGSRYVYPFSPDWAPLDYRGRSIQMRGLTNHRVYHIPFFQSSMGYGFFLNTIARSEWDMAKTDKNCYSIVICENNLDFYLIAGPKFKDITERYTELAGRPPMMPKWMMGEIDEAKLTSVGSRKSNPALVNKEQLNQAGVEEKARARGYVDPYVGMNVRWFDQKEIETSVRHIRKNHFPCDYFHLDSAWQTIRGSLEWVRQIYDPKGMLELLNKLHFKPGLWQRATIERGNYPLYKEAEEKGYLVAGSDGKPFTGVMNDEKKVLVDFTNPQAVKWWNAKTSKLVEMGVKSFKLDSESGGYSEVVPEAEGLKFYNGLTGRELENYHGALYAKAVFEGMKKALKGERVSMQVFFPIYFASGRYPICALGDRKHRCTQENRIKIALTMGLSGVPIWMGGDYDLFGLPHVDRAFNIQLMPYTYSYWHIAHETGLPVIRAMVFDYQDDPESYRADTQFLYGEGFLVAPTIPGSKDSLQIFPPLTDVRGMDAEWEKGKNWRRVYLPEGEWINYWTKEKYMGPEWRYFQIKEGGMQPTFVRGGAIIPFGPMMEYIEEKPADPLTLEIYPYGSSSFTLYEDDGRTYGYESGDYSKTEITCAVGKDGVNVGIGQAIGKYSGMLQERDYLLKVFGTLCPDSVIAGGKTLERLESESELLNVKSGWCYQNDTNYCRKVLIKLPGIKRDKGIKLSLMKGTPLNHYF